MRKIAILGIGQTKVDEHWDKSLKELGGEACFAAMQDAGMNKVDALFVGNMLSPMIDGHCPVLVRELDTSADPAPAAAQCAGPARTQTFRPHPATALA